jgi:hypothetical protein
MPGGFPGLPGAVGPGGAAGDAQEAATDNMEANMEIVLYGVMTLYERYPPRANAPAGAPPTEQK